MTEGRVRPIEHVPVLDEFAGEWVAVKDGQCIFGRAVADALYIDLDVVSSRPLSILGQTVLAATALVTSSLRSALDRP